MPDAGCRMLDAGWRDGRKHCGLVMTSYRDLTVYVDAHALAVELHAFTLRLPKYEFNETGSQGRRSSKSVSATIVEGFARRRYKAEFIKYLMYAQASCDETCEWLAYIRDCHAHLAEEADALIHKYTVLGKRINRLIASVEEGHLCDAEAGLHYPGSGIRHLASKNASAGEEL